MNTANFFRLRPSHFLIPPPPPTIYFPPAQTFHAKAVTRRQSVPVVSVWYGSQRCCCGFAFPFKQLCPSKETLQFTLMTYQAQAARQENNMTHGQCITVFNWQTEVV